MNNWIANVFSGLLAFIHVLVVGGLIMSFFANDIWLESGFYEIHNRVLILTVLFVSYIFFAGFLTIIVSINDYLRKILEKIDRLQMVESNSINVHERIEPSLS